MIPMQYKFLAAIVAIGVILSGTFLFGVDYQKGKEAKKTVKIIKAEVEDHNEDTISLEKHTAIIAQKQKEYQASLDSIPLVDNSITCGISSYERVYNEAIASVNSMHFEN
jgi:hypothetical protein